MEMLKHVCDNSDTTQMHYLSGELFEILLSSQLLKKEKNTFDHINFQTVHGELPIPINLHINFRAFRWCG